MSSHSSVRGFTLFETLVATAPRFGSEPIHCTAYARAFGPPSMSFTSVMPYQLIMAATFGRLVSLPANPPPAQMLVKPALAGIIPVVSARCPPADSPDTTIFAVSML